ncbi:MAG: SufE family protein [Bradymonadia bacterium]
MSLQELIENFELLDDWEDRYRYLIDLGKALPPMPESDKNEETRVRGCVSQVWMTSETVSRDTDGAEAIAITADSDAHIVKGLIAVLLATYNFKTRAEIRGIDIDALFEQLGLQSHLSFNRRNGFFSMVERIRSYASE